MQKLTKKTVKVFQTPPVAFQAMQYVYVKDRVELKVLIAENDPTP